MVPTAYDNAGGSNYRELIFYSYPLYMTITINKKPYTFAASFAELTIDTYLTFRGYFSLPLIERVAKYTGIPAEVLSGLHVKNFNIIAGAVEFIEDETTLNALAVSYEGRNIGLDTFENIERAKKFIKPGIYQGIVKVAELYTRDYVAGRPLLEKWGVCVFYINQLNEFFARFKAMNTHEYTEMESEAGVENLSKFGHWPIVFRMAKERGTTNDAILNMTAIEVYTEMLHNFETAEYQKRLQKITDARRQHFSKVR